MVDPNGPPTASVIVVSDYAGGGDKAWDDLRKTLRALAEQDFDGRAEILLCESTESAPPADLLTIVPGLRLVLAPTQSSYALKNAGVRAATGDVVAIIDADCVPERDWLRHLVAAFADRPRVVAVSGRTFYAGRNLGERLLALLSRAYLDPGHAGATRFVCNNNGALRRAIYLTHPLPEDAGPFGARMQSEAILRDGGELWFEPRMRVVHDFEGWAMEADLRRNAGYGTVTTRLLDPRLPYAWLTRLGYASIPLFVVAKTLDSWRDCLRCARHYGVRWFELPAALALSVVVHAMEAPGMGRAFARRALTATAYR